MSPICASFLRWYKPQLTSPRKHYTDRTPSQQPFSRTDETSGGITCVWCSQDPAQAEEYSVVVNSFIWAPNGRTCGWQLERSGYSQEHNGSGKQATSTGSDLGVCSWPWQLFHMGKTGPTQRTALFWVIAQQVAVIPCRRFGTTYRSHLQR